MPKSRQVQRQHSFLPRQSIDVCNPMDLAAMAAMDQQDQVAGPHPHEMDKAASSVHIIVFNRSKT
jgi:hypothetical protein